MGNKENVDLLHKDSKSTEKDISLIKRSPSLLLEELIEKDSITFESSPQKTLGQGVQGVVHKGMPLLKNPHHFFGSPISSFSSYGTLHSSFGSFTSYDAEVSNSFDTPYTPLTPHTPVAIKTIEKDGELKLENNILLQLTHHKSTRETGVIKYLMAYETESDDDKQLNIVMSLCDQTLQKIFKPLQLCKERKFIFFDTMIINFIFSMERALSTLLTKKVVHRDIKPVNVGVVFPENEEPYFCLIDFDSALSLEQSTEKFFDRCEGNFQYSAPETLLLLKMDNATPETICETDLFSIGQILRELIGMKNYFHDIFEDPHNYFTKKEINAKGEEVIVTDYERKIEYRLQKAMREKYIASAETVPLLSECKTLRQVIGYLAKLLCSYKERENRWKKFKEGCDRLRELISDPKYQKDFKKEYETLKTNPAAFSERFFDPSTRDLEEVVAELYAKKDKLCFNCELVTPLAPKLKRQGFFATLASENAGVSVSKPLPYPLQISLHRLS